MSPEADKTVTMRQVAEAADVSISTVSRALSGDAAVHSESAQRIRRLAASMNYQPTRQRPRSRPATSLQGQRIGIVSMGLDRTLVSLPVIAAAINGAEQALSEAGAETRLVHCPQLDAMPPSIAGHNLDGTLMIGAMHGNLIAERGAPIIEKLAARPMIWLMGRPAGCPGHAVGANDYLVGAQAADYLHQRGHRRLAFINPKPSHLLFRRREDAFIAQARRLGAAVQSFVDEPEAGWPLPIQPPQSTECVQALVDRLLETSPRPTAIFAAADSVAALIYGALARRNITIGKQISVISGNNDRPLIAGLHPSLTTLDIHAHHIGRTAVEQLTLGMPPGNPPSHHETLLDPTLVEGDSVADAAATQ